MGWNSWDCYGPTVTEAEVQANADFMAEKLQRHGWQYVVVDIRWYVENDKAGGYNERNPRLTMDEHGRFWPAVKRFPSAASGQGFKPLADYIHGRGLKFGIHLMRGIPVKAVRENTPILGSDAHAADIYSRDGQCAWLHDMYTIVADRPGAQEYYNSVINLYSSWGIDYIKIDDLSSPYHAAEIELIRRAIDGCGRPIVLSMSPGPTPLDQAEHAAQHANLWRISDDFWDRWDALLPQFERCRKWAPHVGPGHWPDADMLPLGRIGIRAERGRPRNTGFARDEQITLMTLWCIFRSPLMFGGDLPSSDEWTLSLLTNDEVLAVNQRSTGNREVFHREGQVAWVADVPVSRDKYVALFNTRDRSKATDAPADESVEVKFAEIGLNGTCTVRDLWATKDLGSMSDALSTSIPFHGARLLKIAAGRE
jgi:alpha-galactosidase